MSKVNSHNNNASSDFMPFAAEYYFIEDELTARADELLEVLQELDVV